MKEIGISEIYKFRKDVVQHFNDYCSKKKRDNTQEEFVNFLLDFNIIKYQSIRKYNVIISFERLFPEQGFNKTKTVKFIAHNVFDLSERRVWSIIKGHVYSKNKN